MNGLVASTIGLGLIPVVFEAMTLVVLLMVFFHFPIAWACLIGFGVSSISPGTVPFER